MRCLIFIALIFCILNPSLSQKNTSKLNIITESGKKGVKSGKKILVEPQYEDIRIEENGLIAVRNAEGKWGYVDSKGKFLIDPTFEEIRPFEKGYAHVKKEYGWGIIKEDGKYHVQPNFKKITSKDDKTWIGVPYNKITLYDNKKDSIGSFLADSIAPLGKEVYGYYIDGKVGLVEKTGKILTLTGYDSIAGFRNKLASFKKGDRWGVINEEGKEIIPPTYDLTLVDPSSFIRTLNKSENGKEEWKLFSSEGVGITQEPFEYIGETFPPYTILFKKGSLYGFMDLQTRIIQNAVFHSVEKVAFGYIVSGKEGQGLIGFNGDIIYPPFADSIYLLPKGHVLYRQNKVNYLLDSTGREIYCSGARLSALKDGLLEIKVKNKVGRIDFSGKEIVPAKFDSISSLSPDGSLIVYTANQIGLYYSKRDTLVGPNDRIQEIHPVSEDFYGAKIKGKYGFIDGLGRIRIANRYEGVGKFVEGYAPIKLMGKWGFVDKAEVLRVQPLYEEVGNFKNGLAIARKNGKVGILNKKGDHATPFIYDDIQRSESGYFISGKKTPRNPSLILKGLINPEGYEVIFAKYDEVIVLPDGNVRIRKNGNYGIVTSKDLIVFSQIYKTIHFDEFTKNYITIQTMSEQLIKIPEGSL